MYQELIERCIEAFNSAYKGPDPNGAERDAPVLKDYTAVLQGRMSDDGQTAQKTGRNSGKCL